MDNPVLFFLLYLPLLFILYLYTKHFFNKLKNRPPSPFLSLPFLGHLYLAKEPLFRAFANISARYGTVVLLQLGSRPVLIVSSPEAAEECLTKNDIIFANRPHIMTSKRLGYNYTSLGWTSYGDHWRNLRKISSTKILSTQRLELLHHIRVDEVRTMAAGINWAVAMNRVVDMKTALYEVTMNVMMRMISGKRYYGENIKEVEAAKKFREITMDTFRLGTLNIGDFLPVIEWLGLGVEKALMELQKRRDGFMQELVESVRRASPATTAGEKRWRKGRR